MTLPQSDFLLSLIQENDFKIGAELGLAKAHTSRILMEKSSLSLLVGVDLGRRPERYEAQLALSKQYPSRYRLLTMSTGAASRVVLENFFDFVFVDAGHSYTAVRSDILHWTPKVRKGGCICGHDYHEKFPGVIRAVKECFGDSFVVFPEYTIWVKWIQ